MVMQLRGHLDGVDERIGGDGMAVKWNSTRMEETTVGD